MAKLNKIAKRCLVLSHFMWLRSKALKSCRFLFHLEMSTTLKKLKFTWPSIPYTTSDHHMRPSSPDRRPKPPNGCLSFSLRHLKQNSRCLFHLEIKANLTSTPHIYIFSLSYFTVTPFPRPPVFFSGDNHHSPNQGLNSTYNNDNTLTPVEIKPRLTNILINCRRTHIYILKRDFNQIDGDGGD